MEIIACLSALITFICIPFCILGIISIKALVLILFCVFYGICFLKILYELMVWLRNKIIKNKKR
jgi:hypothetical protein